jgi:murein DD-endopeptidase MepM/ murein hydrolase activator NlpD
VVVDGDAEDYDYVFMHLGSGSIPVAEGEHVRTGQRIGDVGSTGRSTGPHLHFEIWAGGWFAGGDPVDPLPLLQAWASPASG